MNPDFLLKSPIEIQNEVARILADYGHHPGHIFNLGHGITPEVPPENVAVLIEAVHSLSRHYHRNQS
jgi:uroporphyrinogen decarboxylase